jgi:hypothetical protein
MAKSKYSMSKFKKKVPGDWPLKMYHVPFFHDFKDLLTVKTTNGTLSLLPKINISARFS